MSRDFLSFFSSFLFLFCSFPLLSVFRWLGGSVVPLPCVRRRLKSYDIKLYYRMPAARPRVAFLLLLSPYV